MRRAIALARKGIGTTSPNPRVGAVVVRGGHPVGEGFHAKAGGPHAEITALRRAGKKARGATLYVTLEPCAHYGRTPPCAPRVVDARVRRVVIGTLDPNPVTARRGLRALKRAGLVVSTGVLEAEARGLNRPFNKWVRSGLPWVVVKAAQSADGKIASFTGESKWISSSASRRRVQELRAEQDAILVGVRTVLSDNPRLDVRIKKGRRPLKIILDSRLRTSPRARLFTTPGKVLIVAATGAKAARKTGDRRRRFFGAEILKIPPKHGRADLGRLMKELGRRGILSVLVEGGGETIASFLEARLADEAYFFIAPKLIGGRRAPTAVEGSGVERISRAPALKQATMSRVGPDFLLHGYF